MLLLHSLLLGTVQGITEYLIARVASIVFGLLAIKYLLKYLERGSFAVFAVYRIVLATIVVVVSLAR